MTRFTDPRIGKARLLRREGKTYDEIRAVVGWVRGDELAQWLRGIPRPPETRRGRDTRAVRRRARQLRSTGRTYPEIATALEVSKSTLSLWLRDMPMERVDPQRFEESGQRRLTALRSAVAQRSAAARTAAAEQVAGAIAQVGTLGDRELKLVGAAIYWAEGSRASLGAAVNGWRSLTAIPA